MRLLPLFLLLACGGKSSDSADSATTTTSSSTTAAGTTAGGTTPSGTTAAGTTPTGTTGTTPTGTTGAGTTPTGTGTTGTGSAVAGDCATYCSDMARVCADEGFHHDPHCLAWCESDKTGVELGTLDDTDANTIGCRQHWLGEAEAASGVERARLCSYAAASGGDQCGSWCDNYCATGVRTCSSANADYPPDARLWFEQEDDLTMEEECEAACDFPTRSTLPVLPVVPQHFGYGDTVQCRLHHYQAAILEGPDQASNYSLHCGHGAPEPTELCTDDTEPNTINYCEYALAFCPELFEPGSDSRDCRAILDRLVAEGTYRQEGFESFAHTSGATLGCLNHRIMTTVHDPAACALADWDPMNWAPRGAGACHP